MPAKRWRIGVDVGGTFTDLALLDTSTGERHVSEVPERADAAGRVARQAYGVACGADGVVDTEATAAIRMAARQAAPAAGGRLDDADS